MTDLPNSIGFTHEMKIQVEEIWGARLADEPMRNAMRLLWFRGALGKWERADLRNNVKFRPISKAVRVEVGAKIPRKTLSIVKGQQNAQSTEAIKR